MPGAGLIPTLPGVASRMVGTSRLRVHLREAGPPGGEPVVLLHGNASSSVFFEELMLGLADRYRVLAPDVRGYGHTERAVVDATRGAGDAADDLAALLDALGIDAPIHLLGWSMGGAWATRFLLDHPRRVRTLTLQAPASPFGFGGTRDERGTWSAPDAAGSGAVAPSAELAARIAAGDQGEESPQSPRCVMNASFWKPPFRPAREEAYLAGLLDMAVGPDHYPGDSVPSSWWPGRGPGRRGWVNALSPRYCDHSALAAVPGGPPVLWVRGADDVIVSDASLFDLATQGQLGLVPGWPGREIAPPQPMIRQTRAVLDGYRAGGGAVTEVLFPDCGHSPHIEHPARFLALFRSHLSGVGS